MYKLTFEIQNPLADQTERFALQFDPATLNQQQWDDAFAVVKERIDAVVERSMAAEPVKWADAVAAAVAKPLTP